MDTKHLIVSNADELNRLHHAVRHAHTQADWNTWKTASAQFQTNYHRLFYPGGEERLSALRQSDEVVISTALDFLEVDPQYFRSGYTKERIWRHLPHCQLSAQDIERLHKIALQYLKRPMRREFWCMCRAMAQLASADLWPQVQVHFNSDDPSVKTRAHYLHAYSQGLESGERVRLQVRHKKVRQDAG